MCQTYDGEGIGADQAIRSETGAKRWKSHDYPERLFSV